MVGEVSDIKKSVVDGSRIVLDKLLSNDLRDDDITRYIFSIDIN